MSACTPSAGMRTEQKLADIDIEKVNCVVVKTPSIALTQRPVFKTELKERIYDAELRVSAIYFAERMAAELKQLEDPLVVKRTGLCAEGLVLKTTIKEFNPGGKLVGGLTMGFAADFIVANSDTDQQLALFQLRHGKGANVFATAVSMASPVPVVSGISDMPAMIDSLVEKALDAIEASFEANKKTATAAAK